MTDWWSLANCQGMPSDLFFPPAGREGAVPTAQAKQVCAGCQVRSECLAHALEHHEVHGLWGGLTATERRALRRPRRRPAHGTRPRYQAGCRCDDCRAANTEHGRRTRWGG